MARNIISGAGCLLMLLLLSSSITAQSGVRRTKPENNQPTTLTIPAGTVFKVELLDPISSKLNEVGDEITASVTSSIFINGVIAIKSGTPIHGRITQVTPAGRPQKQASMTIVFDKIELPNGEQEINTRLKAIDDYANEDKLNANDEGKVRGGHSGGRTVDNATRGVILGGAALPAILVASGSGGAAAGAPLGGAVAGVLLSKGKDIRLSPGTIFRLEFAQTIAVPNNSIDFPINGEPGLQPAEPAQPEIKSHQIPD